MPCVCKVWNNEARALLQCDHKGKWPSQPLCSEQRPRSHLHTLCTAKGWPMPIAMTVHSQMKDDDVQGPFSIRSMPTRRMFRIVEARSKTFNQETARVCECAQFSDHSAADQAWPAEKTDNFKTHRPPSMPGPTSVARGTKCVCSCRWPGSTRSPPEQRRAWPLALYRGLKT